MRFVTACVWLCAGAAPLALLRGGAGVQSTHHPFTAPIPAHESELLAAVSSLSSGVSGDSVVGAGASAGVSDPAARQRRLLSITAQHYDLVLNGMEVAGGSIRCVAGAAGGGRDSFSEGLGVPALPQLLCDAFSAVRTHTVRAE